MKAERDKLEKNLGGIKEMTSLPGLLFVVDLKKEHIAVKEARALGIPVVALVDTNCDPTLVDVVIPGNDDAIRSVRLIAETIADAVIEAKNGNVPEVEKKADDAEITESINDEGEAVSKKVFKKKEEKAEVKAEEKTEEKKATKKAAPKKAEKTEDAEVKAGKKVPAKKPAAKKTEKADEVKAE